MNLQQRNRGLSRDNWNYMNYQYYLLEVAHDGATGGGSCYDLIKQYYQLIGRDNLIIAELD